MCCQKINVGHDSSPELLVYRPLICGEEGVDHVIPYG